MYGYTDAYKLASNYHFSPPIIDQISARTGNNTRYRRHHSSFFIVPWIMSETRSRFPFSPFYFIILYNCVCQSYPNKSASRFQHYIQRFLFNSINRRLTNFHSPSSLPLPMCLWLSFVYYFFNLSPRFLHRFYKFYF